MNFQQPRKSKNASHREYDTHLALVLFEFAVGIKVLLSIGAVAESFGASGIWARKWLFS